MATIHVNRGGTSLGTFSEEDVRAGLRSGRFAGTDLGWREGMASWQSLSQFSEFAADMPSGVPTPPPAAPPPPAILTTTPAPAGSENPPARSGLPWDERQTKGLLNAFIEQRIGFIIHARLGHSEQVRALHTLTRRYSGDRFLQI